VSGSVLRFDEINAMDGKRNPFVANDATVLVYARKCVRRYAALKRRLVTWDRDDDYAVMLWVWELYNELWGYYTDMLSECAAESYGYVSSAEAPAGIVDDYVSKSQPVEGWVPRNEWERKRSYLFEGVVAAKGTGRSMTDAVDSARKRWGRQMSQSADDVTAAAMLRAYADAGATRVKWVTQHDDRVCSTCGPRDGKTYSIGNAPQYPAHWGCRCLLVPVVTAR